MEPPAESPGSRRRAWADIDAEAEPVARAPRRASATAVSARAKAPSASTSTDSADRASSGSQVGSSIRRGKQMTNPRRLGRPAEPAPRPHVENRLRPNECEIAAAPCRSQARARRRAHGRHQRLRTQLLVRALGRAEPLVMVTRPRVVGRSRPPDRLSAMRREADRPIRLWNDVPQRVRPA